MIVAAAKAICYRNLFLSWWFTHDLKRSKRDVVGGWWFLSWTSTNVVTLVGCDLSWLVVSTIFNKRDAQLQWSGCGGFQMSKFPGVVGAHDPQQEAGDSAWILSPEMGSGNGVFAKAPLNGYDETSWGNWCTSGGEPLPSIWKSASQILQCQPQIDKPLGCLMCTSLE